MKYNCKTIGNTAVQEGLNCETKVARQLTMRWWRCACATERPTDVSLCSWHDDLFFCTRQRSARNGAKILTSRATLRAGHVLQTTASSCQAMIC